MSIRYPEAAAAWAAWERAQRLAGELGSVMTELGLEEYSDYYIPRAFRHGGRQWRVIGPYIAETSSDGDGGIVAVFTSDGEPRAWGVVEYLCLDDGSRYPIED